MPAAEADADKLAGAPRVITLALEAVVTRESQQLVERRSVIAGIEHRARRSSDTGKASFGDKIAPAQLGRDRSPSPRAAISIMRSSAK